MQRPAQRLPDAQCNHKKKRVKLSLDTHSIGTDLTLNDLLALLPANGFDGVEFRCEAGQKHGVEPEIAAPERRRVKALLDGAGLAVSCLSTSQRFESPDPKARRAVIERVKQFVDLAADLGCKSLRTFGNDFPPDVPRPDVVQYVGESLRACGEYAADKGVDVLLEMHGQFYYWEYCLGAVQIADHPNVAINYNCDPRDLENPGFPYKELFGLLKGMNYDRFCSLEEGYHEGGEPKVIALYAALFRELVA